MGERRMLCLLALCLLLSGCAVPDVSRQNGSPQVAGPYGSVDDVVPSKVPDNVAPHTITQTIPQETDMQTASDILTSSTDSTRSILDFLRIAIQPVGQTMYVWGGGWNEEDTAAGIEAVTLGVSPGWAAFAAKQDAAYDYQTTRYQIHDGLDCSGYVGWAVYNVLETENGREGYVLSSTKMAQSFADRGLGSFIPAENMNSWQAGDIMSMKGHVWICIGMCEDGSVLLLHSSPPGVIFCGTKLPDGGRSQAVELAETIMSTHYPDWYAKYPACSRSHFYLTDSSAMRWSREVLRDEEGLCRMTAAQVAEILFAETGRER